MKLPHRPAGTGATALGIHPLEERVFIALANERRWNVFVRTGHISRIRHAGSKLYRPKTAGVYMKTDRARGGIVYSTGASDEFSSPLIAGEGFHRDEVDGRVRDRWNNSVIGDIDLQGVYDEGHNRVPQVIWARELQNRFAECPIHSAAKTGPGRMGKALGVRIWEPIQHGAHDEWENRNNAEYCGGLNMGPIPGVVWYRPGSSVLLPSTRLYREILRKWGREDIYIEQAWDRGAKRDREKGVADAKAILRE